MFKICYSETLSGICPVIQIVQYYTYKRQFKRSKKADAWETLYFNKRDDIVNNQAGIIFNFVIFKTCLLVFHV